MSVLQHLNIDSTEEKYIHLTMFNKQITREANQNLKTHLLKTLFTNKLAPSWRYLICSTLQQTQTVAMCKKTPLWTITKSKISLYSMLSAAMLC
jgi:hypothetical protein